MKRRNFYIIHYFAMAMLIGFSSCSNKDKKVEDIISEINVDKTTRTSPNELFTDLELIPLTKDSTSFSTNIKKMDVYDDCIIACDSRNVIYVFSLDGKYKYSSEKKMGNGAGEYAAMTTYTYNPFSHCIEIITPRNLIIYDSHFNHLKTKGIPSEVSNTGEDFLYFGTIFDLSANIHLLIPSSLSKNKNSIIIYDSNKEEILKSISYSDDILAGITMQNNCFSNISDSQLLFYPPSLSNYVYNFNTQTLTLSKRFGISWKEKGIDLKDIEKYGTDVEQLNDYLLTCDKDIPVRIMQVANHIVILMKKGNNLEKWYTIFYDISSNNIFQIPLYDNDKPLFPVISSTYQGSLYAVVDAEDLSFYTESIQPKYTENFIDEDGLVIIKYNLK